MSTKRVITALTPAELQQLQSQPSHHVIVIKFGAEWCGPCKLIKSTCEQWFNNCPDNIIYANIDIDESLDLYMALKNKKMLRGVPTIIAFDNSIANREHWYIPDDSVEGGDVNAVIKFFNRCTLFLKV
jgi:thioredoxin-like negative regulator of GroEL